jgi:hypothetical protein
LTDITRPDHERNTDIREKLNVPHIICETGDYQQNWLQHRISKREHRSMHWHTGHWNENKQKLKEGGEKIPPSRGCRGR